MPIGLLTLGLVAFVINAAMLLLTAWLSGALTLGFKLWTFPPTLNSDAIVGALVAAVIISVVSTLASVALSPRKLL
jgi:putative membrane protein